jgi:hypothetical protein
MLFKVNEGMAERAIRVVIGLLFLAYALFGMQTLVVDYSGSWQQWVLFALSALFLITGFTGVCPAYSLWGMATGKGWICPTCTKKEQEELRAVVEDTGTKKKK